MVSDFEKEVVQETYRNGIELIMYHL